LYPHFVLATVRVANVHGGLQSASAMIEQFKSKNPPGSMPGGFGGGLVD
jgi:hypothetical protein